MTEPSFYDSIGGAEVFSRLVARFYQLVPDNEILAAMYPADDLAGAENRLRMFLEQYWGGPRTYFEQRGHPRLRLRHAPYRIDRAARDAWLGAMTEAVDSIPLTLAQRQRLLDYLTMAADSLVNTPG